MNNLHKDYLRQVEQMNEILRSHPQILASMEKELGYSLNVNVENRLDYLYRGNKC